MRTFYVRISNSPFLISYSNPHIRDEDIPSKNFSFPHLLFCEQFHDNKCRETNGACISQVPQLPPTHLLLPVVKWVGEPD